MSEDSGNYQVSNEVLSENVDISSNAISNALEEKMHDSQAAKTLNSYDIEAEDHSQEKPVEEEKDQFSSKFAALSRKEKDLRAKERQVEDRIAQFEARMAEMEAAKNAEPVEPALPPLEYRLKKDPLKTLEEIGYSYEDLTKMVLNDGQMSQDMQMRLMREEMESDYKSKFEELEQKLTQKERQEEEAKYQETLNSFKADIKDFVNSSEDYELIQANDAVDLVYDVIEQYYEENGRILDTAEAASQVEQYLEEELQKVLEKSKKLKSRLTPAAPAPQAPQQRQSPTLSNSHSATSTQTRSDKLLSREESIAELAKQIRWED